LKEKEEKKNGCLYFFCVQSFNGDLTNLSSQKLSIMFEPIHLGVKLWLKILFMKKNHY